MPPDDELTARQLAHLLDPERPSRWDPADADAALRHQLAAPLWPDLASAPAADSNGLARLLQVSKDAPPTTFQDSLTSSQPHPDILHAIKHFARHHRDDPQSPLAGDPATVLYYAAIAAALLRLQTRITQLTDAQIREGCKWALDQPGAASLRDLFDAALQILT